MANHYCRQKGCPNAYTDIVGVPGSWGKNSEADCVPCFYAALLIQNGQTPEQIEKHLEMMKEFIPHLEETGWSWQDVKDSFNRVPAPMVM